MLSSLASMKFIFNGWNSYRMMISLIILLSVFSISYQSVVQFSFLERSYKPTVFHFLIVWNLYLTHRLMTLIQLRILSKLVHPWNPISPSYMVMVIFWTKLSNSRFCPCFCVVFKMFTYFELLASAFGESIFRGLLVHVSALLVGRFFHIFVSAVH